MKMVRSPARRDVKDLKLDDKTIELIAVGASITAGCQPCLRHHTGKARQLGAEDGEIAEAIAVGKMVRGGEASEMDRFAEKLAEEAAPNATETPQQEQESGGCDCGGVCC
jgi:AhpD family alkylhydroperoxidase